MLLHELKWQPCVNDGWRKAYLPGGGKVFQRIGETAYKDPVDFINGAYFVGTKDHRLVSHCEYHNITDPIMLQAIIFEVIKETTKCA